MVAFSPGLCYNVSREGRGLPCSQRIGQAFSKRLWERPNAEADVVGKLKIPLLFFCAFSVITRVSRISRGSPPP